MCVLVSSAAAAVSCPKEGGEARWAAGPSSRCAQRCAQPCRNRSPHLCSLFFGCILGRSELGLHKVGQSGVGRLQLAPAGACTSAIGPPVREGGRRRRRRQQHNAVPQPPRLASLRHPSTMLVSGMRKPRSRAPSKASVGAPARLRAPAPSQREGLQSACLQDDGSEVRERGRTREPAAAGNLSAPARA